MNNPLLEPTDLPAFSQIQPENIQPAIETLISRNRESIADLTAHSKSDWDSLVKPLSLMEDRLSKAWSPVRHLNSVKSNDALREAYNNCLPLLSEYATEVSQNRDLYQRYQNISRSQEFNDFSQAQKKTITDALLHFRLGGVDLEGEAQQRYQQLQKDLSELESSFENNCFENDNICGLHTKDSPL